MLQTLPKAIVSLVALTTFVFTASAMADDYRDARTELVAAYQAMDYVTMREAAKKALAARPGYPNALFNLAYAQVLDGDAGTALETLQSTAAMRIDFGVDAVEEFAPLKALPGWDDYAAAIASIGETVGEVEIAFTHEMSDFVPEGIAVTADGELLLGSIRHGVLLRKSGGGETVVEPDGHWSVFGMRADDRGGLWFASAAVPQFAAVDESSSGNSGLFRLRLDDNTIDIRAALPKQGDSQVLGDLVIADDRTIYTTDSIDGPLYRYSIEAGEFETVVPAGVFGSPQGLALDDSGSFLYVADYIGGLFRVSVADGSVAKVGTPDDVSAYGIDGLYRHGNDLVAIQNGIRPNRVVRLGLSTDGRSIVSSEILAMNLEEFDEPTLGTVVGDDFYLVANSHWNRFDHDNNLPADLDGPVILKLSLRR